MKKAKRLGLGIAGVTAAATALLGVAVLPGAQAAQRSQPAAAAVVPADGGIPAAVNPGTDLAAQTPGSQPGWNQSIYVTSWVKGGGHDFGILVQTLDFPGNGQRGLTVSVVDETTGWYKNYQAAIPADQYTWSTKKLYISMPGLTWTGDAQQMSVHATTPWGVISTRLTATGPTLDYAGTGLFSLLGDPNYEFALPVLRTTGTLTLGGKTVSIAGESWLDRQWGPIDLSSSGRWTWMNINLSNGDKVAIWDFLNAAAENSWATVLRPDGSYELAVVRPLADGASHPWTSPASGNTYPTRWSMDIPALHSRLRVAITGTDDQELASSGGGRMEATAAVTGSYEGAKVTGVTYVEMVGDWKA